jgi:hypothetical protein
LIGGIRPIVAVRALCEAGAPRCFTARKASWALAEEPSRAGCHLRHLRKNHRLFAKVTRYEIERDSHAGRGFLELGAKS